MEEDRYDLYAEKKKGKFSKFLNFLFYAGIVALILFAAMYFFGPKSATNDDIDIPEETEKIIEVETTEVTDDPLERVNFNKVGTIEPYKTATITAQAAGSLGEFSADEGDKVEKDQILASIQNSVSTQIAEINLNTAMQSLINAQNSLSGTNASIDRDIQMAALGVSTAEVNLRNSIDAYNNLKVTLDQQIAQSRIAVEAAQDSYYNTRDLMDSSLDDTLDNSLSSVVSAFTLVEQASILAERELNYDGGLSSTYSNLRNQYERVDYAEDAIDLIEDTLDALEDGQDILFDVKDFTEDQNTKTTATTLISSIDMAKSGLNMSKQTLNTTILNNDFQPQSANTGLESAQQALNIALASRDSQLDATFNGIDMAQKQVETAILQLENVKTKGNLQRISAQSQLTQVQGQTDIAAANLDGTKVVSPIEGILLQKYIEEGNYTNPGQNIIKVGNMSKVYVVVSLTGEELKFVKLGQSVQIRAPGGVVKTGKITKVLPSLDPISKKVEVKVLIDNKDSDLIDGMFTDIIFTEAQKDSTGVLIPFKSIIFETSGTYVYIIENNKAVKQLVKLGQIAGNQIEVIDGLTLGDKVITKGAKLVEEGQAVKDVSTN